MPAGMTNCWALSSGIWKPGTRLCRHAGSRNWRWSTCRSGACKRNGRSPLMEGMSAARARGAKPKTAISSCPNRFQRSFQRVYSNAFLQVPTQQIHGSNGCVLQPISIDMAAAMLRPVQINRHHRPVQNRRFETAAIRGRRHPVRGRRTRSPPSRPCRHCSRRRL